MDFVNNKPSAPYFIFIKGLSHKSDTEILNLLEFTDHHETPQNIHENSNCLYMSRDNSWVHIMDNWSFTFFDSDKLTQKINELGQWLEVFTCSVGDYDYSFDFVYFKEGTRVREYSVSNSKVIKDSGTSIGGEAEASKIKNELDKVLYIAKSLGIKLPSHKDRVSCYEIKEVLD